jgi:ectoine hydroxylase-related dioxygenase (phytanoyl-CoA dioxygenase family)
VTGRAGTCVLFHCNVLHASGHNLSADDRWHIYVSCNTVANKPQLGDNPRPAWVVSRNWKALPIEDDEGVLKAAQQQYREAIGAWERVIDLEPAGEYARRARRELRSANDLKHILGEGSERRSSARRAVDGD